jgi:hypothetical protein
MELPPANEIAPQFFARFGVNGPNTHSQLPSLKIGEAIWTRPSRPSNPDLLSLPPCVEQYVMVIL